MFHARCRQRTLGFILALIAGLLVPRGANNEGDLESRSRVAYGRAESDSILVPTLCAGHGSDTCLASREVADRQHDSGRC